MLGLRRAMRGKWRPARGGGPGPRKVHLFRVGLGEVTVIRWDDAINGQYVTRWPAGPSSSPAAPRPPAKGGPGGGIVNQ
jgi:hypothetical protein